MFLLIKKFFNWKVENDVSYVINSHEFCTNKRLRNWLNLERVTFITSFYFLSQISDKIGDTILLCNSIVKQCISFRFYYHYRYYYLYRELWLILIIYLYTLFKLH